MSLEQLQYFVAVAEEGAVGRAARRLRVSQPPLTRQLQRLEDELGTKLFERSARGMRLLPPGAVFLTRVRSILRELDLAVAATRVEATHPVDLRLTRPPE
jgi:DNA-binding transcriptional LysR family regulator